MRSIRAFFALALAMVATPAPAQSVITGWTRPAENPYASIRIVTPQEPDWVDAEKLALDFYFTSAPGNYPRDALGDWQGKGLRINDRVFRAAQWIAQGGVAYSPTFGWLGRPEAVTRLLGASPGGDFAAGFAAGRDKASAAAAAVKP